MSNWFLTNRQVAEIEKLAAQGKGKRLIARLTGVSRPTVTRYVEQMKIPPSKCACGRPYDHRGRCEARRAANEKA